MSCEVKQATTVQLVDVGFAELPVGFAKNQKVAMRKVFSCHKDATFYATF